MKSALPLIGMILLAGCDMLPRDPDGTLDRIVASKALKVGVVDGTRSADHDRVRALVGRIERQTGARAIATHGPTDAMFAALDDERLDMVIGRFSADSPWATRIAFAPALAGTEDPDAPMELKAAMRNGENRWIMLVERSSRAVAQDGGR